MHILLSIVLVLILSSSVFGTGRFFEDQSSEYAEVQSAILNTDGFTIAAWVRDDNTTYVSTERSVFWIGDSADAAQFRTLFITNSAGNPFSVKARSENGSGAEATSTATAAQQTYIPIAGIFGSATSRDAFVSGGNKGSNTTSIIHSGDYNRTSIGGRRDSSPNRYFSGDICWVAVWDIELADAEIAALGTGTNPMRVRPLSLAGVWPLWAMHSPEINLIGQGFQLTLTGTTASAGGCPVTPLS